MLNILKKGKHKEHCAVRLGRFMNEDVLDIGTRDLSGGGGAAQTVAQHPSLSGSHCNKCIGGSKS